MIVLLLLAAAVYGVSYAVRRARAASHEHLGSAEPELAVEPLSGPGWSLVALDSAGPLRAVDLDDPQVDCQTDIALGLRDHDIN